MNAGATRFAATPQVPASTVTKTRWRWPLMLGLTWALTACGGGDEAGSSGRPLNPEASSRSALTAPLITGAFDATAPAVAPPATKQKAMATASLAAAGAFNGGVADPGLLMLLVPDDLSLPDDRVRSWTDAAAEVGTRMAVVTDAQFLAMGATGALRYAGLVLPDQLHTVATDALIAAIRDYTTQGGRVLLSFDFAALTLNADGEPVYPIPRSRLSDLAGVDYALYDQLRDRTVGLGPVTALRSTLRSLLVPPGKSMPYPAPAVATAGKFSAASRNPAPVGAGDVAAQGLLAAAGLESQQALYLPVSPSDPGGVLNFDPQQFQNLPMASTRNRENAGVGQAPRRQVQVRFGRAVKAQKVSGISPNLPASTPLGDQPVASSVAGQSAPTKTTRQAVAAAPADPLESYHGYLLGHLIYPSYVTTGTFAGTTLATSPFFGLVAGVQAVGKGQVLFVNLPLGYLKGRTDALPMHGFLHHFAHKMVRGARLSGMPNAVAGLTFDWHLDSMDAQAPTLTLEAAGIFRRGPFSMEMTAGPDAVVPGDGLGWNLNGNPVAQKLLRRLDKEGHAIGSHGGWVHDYYGYGADETNAVDFLPLLVQNRAAVDGAVGRPSRSYSAPMGNNPTWAMDWLEQQGVVGAYFAGHTGLGATRHYRDGVLRNPSLYVFPVTPQGLYATFEEFQDFSVPKQEVTDWYHSLVDFSIAQNTNRMIYAHPPGAYEWLDVTKDLLNYAQSKKGSFQWYTMPELADFMARQQNVVWTETLLNTGATRFEASHPVHLGKMVWMLPKDRYRQPVVVSGSAKVENGGSVWLVKAAAVKLLRFQAMPI